LIVHGSRRQILVATSPTEHPIFRGRPDGSPAQKATGALAKGFFFFFFLGSTNVVLSEPSAKGIGPYTFAHELLIDLQEPL
jgi:hypothetical protein